MQPPLVAGLLSEWQISHLFLANNKRFSPVKSVGIVSNGKLVSLISTIPQRNSSLFDEMEQNEV